MMDLNTLVERADAAGHKPKMESGPDLIDEVKCSCGWKSNPYYDGRTFATNEWRRHIEKELSELRT